MEKMKKKKSSGIDGIDGISQDCLLQGAEIIAIPLTKINWPPGPKLILLSGDCCCKSGLLYSYYSCHDCFISL